MIVDSSVLLDGRASNAAGGPWSFRWLIEQMATAGQRPGDLVEAWLRTFRASNVEGAPVGDRPAVEDLLGTGPHGWPRAADGSLDLSRAPFRLLAIVNRVDLVSNGTAASGTGEARFVFGLIDRATDQPDLMAIALEYRLPALGTADDRREWAKRWHALSSLPFGSSYNAALETLTRAFAGAGVDASGAGGNALSQLRSNEGRFGATWEMRQWVLERQGSGTRLRPALLPQTPRFELNGSADLARLLVSNRTAVLAGTQAVPAESLAGSSAELGSWAFDKNPEVDPPLRHAFAVRTCSGCHASETESLQGFFHINPFQPPTPGGDGRDRLSPYLKLTQMGERVANVESLLAGRGVVPEVVPPLPTKPTRPLYRAALVPGPADGAPIALGANGSVLGNSANGPWLSDGSHYRYLIPGATRQLFAKAINAGGDIAGVETRADGTRRAFAVIRGTLIRLGTLGGGYSAAAAIDDSGRVAGDSTTSSGDHHSFLYRDGAMVDLGTLGGGETLSFAINQSGQVVGQSQRDDGARHGFLFDGQRMRDLGTLGGAFVRAQAVNSSGQSAGMSELVPGDRKIHAFFHDGAALHDLGSLPGLPWTSATGLNDSGVVVGNVYNKPDYEGAQYQTFAFVYRDGVLSNLNDLIQPSSFTLLTTLSIDAAGRILCTDGQTEQAQANGYLLTPQ